MENKEMNKRMELSLEELDKVTGAGMFDFFADLGYKIVDTIKDLFD